MIYKLCDVEIVYKELLNLSKLIINISSKTNNLELEEILAKYFLNNSVKRANVIYIIKKENSVIGALLGYIPNYCSEIENIHNYNFASISNTKLLKELKSKNWSSKELNIIKHELFLEEQYFQHIWNKTLKRNDSSEILFFSISSNQQGKGYSKILLKSFLEDSKNSNINKYHLFTTSNCDYEYYEKLGMECKTNNKVAHNINMLVYQKRI